jgi:hypothetical protein
MMEQSGEVGELLARWVTTPEVLPNKYLGMPRANLAFDHARKSLTQLNTLQTTDLKEGYREWQTPLS